MLQVSRGLQEGTGQETKKILPFQAERLRDIMQDGWAMPTLCFGAFVSDKIRDRVEAARIPVTVICRQLWEEWWVARLSGEGKAQFHNKR